jgi:NAD+ synthase
MNLSEAPRHFSSTSQVLELVEEIKARHQRSYQVIAQEMISQITAFFDRSFAISQRPSRFATAQNQCVQPRLLLGLSGGIDSSVVAYLAAKAVGTESLLCITMPARPGDESVELAALVRSDLELNDPSGLDIIDIEPIIKIHMQVMSQLDVEQVQLGTNHANQVREQKMRSGNFASRVRTAVLSDLQRAIRGRILGTVNRTEYCQGYGTKFGTPISYDFGVLNELYKIDIYQLAITLGVPQQILDTPPTTGFFEGQTHAGELGATIEEQDIFAYLLFEKNLSPQEVSQIHHVDEAFCNVMHHRFVVSEHKRVLNLNQERVNIARTELIM